MEFLPSISCVNTTLQVHHMDTDKTYREKARWELHRIALSYIEQILESTPHKTAAVPPLTSHLKSIQIR